jgi:hypothetical protein
MGPHCGVSGVMACHISPAHTFGKEGEIKVMSLFEEIKNIVTYEELDNIMGWRYTRRGDRLWIHSPLNANDKNPSLCQYQGSGWKDYSTGYGGSDVISLFAKVKEIKQIEAARELASIFNISNDGSYIKPQRFNRNNFFKSLEEWAKKTFITLCDYLHAVDNTITNYPNKGDEVFPALLELREQLDRWTELLMSENLDNIVQVYKSLRGWHLALH